MLYLDDAIIERRSVRRFKPTPVDSDKILKILDAGRLAPSAKNRQPWRFNVLSTQQKNRIAELLDIFVENNTSHGTEKATAQIIRSAPNVIAVMLTSTTRSDYISIGACLENMSLKAVDLGLGSLIVCDTQSIEHELSELFDDNQLAALFVVGYDDDNQTKRNKKELSEIVSGIDIISANITAIDSLPEANVDDEPFIFISYSHRDADIVISDIVELKKFGVRLWYDRSICYGDIWDEKALSIISKHNCKGILLYISNNAVQSASVAKELNHANNRFADKSQIISIHIGDKPLSEYPIPNELSSVFATIPEEKKYIPRSVTPHIFNLQPIVSEAERLGAVSASGVYDEFSYEVSNDGVRITRYNGCSHTVEIISNVAGIPVVTIGKNVFRGNNNVYKIVVPTSVKRIEEGAFFDMTSLQEIDLPQNLDYLGVAAFRGCVSLKTIKLPDGISKLSEALFRDCTALVECDVPDTVVEFGEAVFRNCSSLRRVNMPSVKKMTEGGFYGCTELCELTIDPEIQGLEIQSFDTCPHINVTAGGFAYINGKGNRV